jgi:hypothetical protein
MLIAAGADMFVRDRWGVTPFDEAQRGPNMLTVEAVFRAASRGLNVGPLPALPSCELLRVL